MTAHGCDRCGALNAASALFCSSCQAYLGWDMTTVQPVIRDPVGSSERVERVVETEERPVPSRPDAGREAAKSDPAGSLLPGVDRLAAALKPAAVEVALDAEPVVVEVAVHNRSDIVDGYMVDAPGAPPWLEVLGAELRLMPDANSTVRLSLRIREGVLAIAQTTPVAIRVRSRTSVDLVSMLTVSVCVPETGRPVAMRIEPSVIRVKDQRDAEFRVVADNSANNHPVHLRLSSEDAEQVMAVAFGPPVLSVPAGRTAAVSARVEAPVPEAGQESSRQLLVSGFDGRHLTQANLTFVQRSSVQVADPPIGLRLHPSVVQATDSPTGQLRLEIDNSNGREGARVALSAWDDEGLISFRFTPPTVDIAPGSTATVFVGLAAVAPEPGGEGVHPFTLVARYGSRTVDARGSFRQRTSAAALTAVKLRVEPPVVRVKDSDRGRTRVIADNRLGSQPARMWLHGRDHEGSADISFSVPYLDVEPGQQAAADAEIRARRPSSGSDSNRGFTITASDGKYEVSAEGTFSQTVSDRRPLWRTLFTLLGGLAMAVGSLLPWTRGSGRTGFEWTARAISAAFDGKDPNLDPNLANVASAGAVVVLLAGLAVWGRLGVKGRLTRLSSLLGLLGIVGFLVALGVRSGDGTPSVGAIVVAVGCVSAYVGGQLAKR